MLYLTTALFVASVLLPASSFAGVGRHLFCGYQGKVRATVWHPSPIIGTPEGAVIILIG